MCVFECRLYVYCLRIVIDNDAASWLTLDEIVIRFALVLISSSVIWKRIRWELPTEFNE